MDFEHVNRNKNDFSQIKRAQAMKYNLLGNYNEIYGCAHIQRSETS